MCETKSNIRLSQRLRGTRSGMVGTHNRFYGHRCRRRRTCGLRARPTPLDSRVEEKAVARCGATAARTAYWMRWGVLRVAWGVECEKPTEGADVVGGMRMVVGQGEGVEGGGEMGAGAECTADGDGVVLAYAGDRSRASMLPGRAQRGCSRALRGGRSVTQERDDSAHARELNREEGGEYKERKGGWEGNGLRKGKPRKRTLDTPALSILHTRKGDEDEKHAYLRVGLQRIVRSESAPTWKFRERGSQGRQIKNTEDKGESGRTASDATVTVSRRQTRAVTVTARECAA
ncbi:hypothetical protein B0H14DRAFT_2632779 [Mycena olivaceomarginata]|nr:hypothetical protein B0H14DRAFT_2632779 [Mycena olivaceomarginata]